MKPQFITVKLNATSSASASMMACAFSGRAAKAVRQCGVTMIELLVVIVIAAIVAAIAAPSLQSTLNNFRQKSAQSLLVSDLNQARAEAIKRNTRTLVCVRNSAGTGCGSGANWQAGWVVCTDSFTTSTGLPPSDDECDAATTDNPNPFIVRPALDAVLALTAPATPLHFNANSSQGSDGTAATLTLGGTWSGAVANVITVAPTGNIAK
jgi:prepilin-type N-terminal cleavage/methylation domain-containing protein